MRYTSATVAYTIPDIVRSRKGQDVILVVILVLLAVCAFGLGRLSKGSTTQAAVALCNTTDTSDMRAAYPVAAQDAPATPQGKVVASKGGSVYHLPWCSGATRIKEENKVWFASEARAQAAGYRPAANCKGLTPLP